MTYLDFWASWCGPCRLSLPALNRLNTDFSPDDFAVVAISVDYVDEDALDFLSRYPVDYPSRSTRPGIQARLCGIWHAIRLSDWQGWTYSRGPRGFPQR